MNDRKPSIIRASFGYTPHAALHIPEQFRKTKILRSALDGYEHRDFWDLQPGAVFKLWRKLNKEANWQSIQDLDWTAVKSWGQNYESLQTDFHMPALLL